MVVSRKRYTDQQIQEMRERNAEMCKGISFSEEYLNSLPPVSEGDKIRIKRICESAWKEAFLSSDETITLSKELGGNIDVESRWKPINFCVWNWWKVSEDVRLTTMLEF